MNNYINTYLMFFSLFAIILWFYYYFALYVVKERKTKKEYKGRIVVLVPTYNEKKGWLKDTIESVKNAKGVEKILFINDGSTQKEVIKTLKENLDKNQYLDLKQNIGKREAQRKGMELLVNEYGEDYFDAVVLMDSDTVLKKDSIIKLARKLNFKKVGAVTAQILCRNKKENLLTRNISAMYWSASNIWRKAPARYGYVQVTNGQLSIYKFKPILEMMDKYTNQYFFGVKCSFSDDRWLSQHLQVYHNYEIEYEPEAIAYTYIPTTIKSAWKMFLRWKKGSLRETLLMTKNITRHPLLVLDCWWNNLVSILQTGVRLIIIYLMFFNPMILFYYLLMVAFISCIYALDMLIENPKEIPYRIMWSWMNEIIFSWIVLVAIKDIKKQGWSTR